MVTSVNAGARLDRLPSSKFHRRMLILIGLGIFFDTVEIAMQNSILGALVHSGWSTLQLNAMFISGTFAGVAVGAALAGWLGDKFGRKFSYQFNLLIFGVGSLLCALAPSMQWLIGLRTLTGIGLGAEWVVGYSIIAEFLPPQNRGRATSIVGFASMTAGFFASGVAYFIIPTFGWRWMFVIAGLFALWVWYLRKNLPESPRWLEANGRPEEAERILATIEAEVAREHALPPPLPPAAAPVGRVSMAVLFSRPVIRRTLLVILINVVIGITNYGFNTWLSTFFVKQGLGLEQALKYQTIISFGGVMGPLLAIWLADSVGRKNGIALSAVLAAAAALSFSFVSAPLAVLASGFCLTAFTLLLMTLAIAIYGPELFPTEYRMRGSGLGQFAGRITAMMAPYAILYLYTGWGIAGAAGLPVVSLLILAAVMVLFGVETRRKSLEKLNPDAVAGETRILAEQQ
jgi:putative MFS transporter